MPYEIDRRAFFQLTLLLLAVPIQYYLVNLKPTTEETKLESLQSIWKRIHETRIYLRESWPFKECIDAATQLITSLTHIYNNNNNNSPDSESLSQRDAGEGESPATEVLKSKFTWSDSGHFATSIEPRYPRPPSIKYRIGQVVKHKQYGYRGVIVGWDTEAKAPESWIKDNHGRNKSWRQQPNYAVLIDIRDRTVPQIAYCPEVNIELAPSSVRIMHPGMEEFFEAYDGAQYLPRPWLQTIYPMDT